MNTKYSPFHGRKKGKGYLPRRRCQKSTAKKRRGDCNVAATVSKEEGREGVHKKADSIGKEKKRRLMVVGEKKNPPKGKDQKYAFIGSDQEREGSCE